METRPMKSPPVVAKQLNHFERYLTIWVTLCMIAGIVIPLVAAEHILVDLLRLGVFAEP